jgi:hypothetical protein
VVITLNGSDIEGDPLTFKVDSPPAHGTWTLIGQDFIYTPAAGYSGADSFTFVANDGNLDSEPALVSVKINYFINLPLVLRVTSE